MTSPDGYRKGWLAAVCVLLLGAPSASWAVDCTSPSKSINLGWTITYSTGLHNTASGVRITSPFIESHDPAIDCTSTSIYLTGSEAFASGSALSGRSYTDPELNIRHDVFPTNVPGIGFALSAAPAGTNDFKAVKDSFTRIHSNVYSQKLGVNYRVHLVTTGPLTAGSYNLSGQHLATLHFISPDSNTVSLGFLYLSGRLDIQTSTCAINGPSNSSLTLPPVSMGAMSAVPIGGNPLESSELFASTIECDGKVSVWASLSDATTPSNTSTVLTTLGGPNAAEGIGLQLFTTSALTTPLQLGPDTTSASHPGAWHIGDTSQSGGNRVLYLFARYVRTAQTLKPGDVNGVATVTLSYR